MFPSSSVSAIALMLLSNEIWHEHKSDFINFLPGFETFNSMQKSDAPSVYAGISYFVKDWVTQIYKASSVYLQHFKNVWYCCLKLLSLTEKKIYF